MKSRQFWLGVLHTAISLTAALIVGFLVGLAIRPYNTPMLPMAGIAVALCICWGLVTSPRPSAALVGSAILFYALWVGSGFDEHNLKNVPWRGPYPTQDRALAALAWCVATLLAWGLSAGRKWIIEGRERSFARLCDGCGYNLVGLAGDRCPECGRTISMSRNR